MRKERVGKALFFLSEFVALSLTPLDKCNAD